MFKMCHFYCNFVSSSVYSKLIVLQTLDLNPGLFCVGSDHSVIWAIFTFTAQFTICLYSIASFLAWQA